ncbi:hypothetical protein [Xanthobacter sp. 126]|uniref:hypothetical protein n=1 Tax=Xanthobacter sp. 126 TaxID=1131814 RepID=UPI0012DCDD24|nr:hypothetical protein [Xanthobacter sp. 126]
MADGNAFDPDIDAMDLDVFEKHGLQLYRNYTRAFESHAEKRFAEQIDSGSANLSELERIAHLIVQEDPRFLPMIVCAYADDELRNMFKISVPEGVPGGKSDILGRMGPFSDLAKRIQLSYIFSMISHDLCIEFDKLRLARNKLAHSWDITSLRGFFEEPRIATINGPTEALHEGRDWFPDPLLELSGLQRFRINLLWLVARMAYEARFWAKARKHRLQPHQALYGKNSPRLLGKISHVAMVATQQVVDEGRKSPIPADSDNTAGSPTTSGSP